MPVLGRRTALMVRQDGRKLQFLLSAEQRESLEVAFWPETPGSLRRVLKRRYAFCAPIAALFVLVSLPLPADQAAGLEGIPFDPLSLALGLGLLVLWLHARLAPKAYLFATDSVWFGLLALSVAWDVLRGGSSPLWLGWSLFLAYLAVQGFKLYGRFRSIAPDGVPQAAA